MPNKVDVDVKVNGDRVLASVPAEQLLIEFLRDQLHLTGTKEGCGVGICGACSVLVDGQLQTSCLILTISLNGKSVTTIEGLSREPAKFTALQYEFVQNGGIQCGFCTPGQIIAATALARESPNPSVAEVKRWMSGNLCRCTGYYKIIESITAALHKESS